MRELRNQDCARFLCGRCTWTLAAATGSLQYVSRNSVFKEINPYPAAFPYGNVMVLHFYQQQESSTTKTVHKVINKRLKAYVYSPHTGENFHYTLGTVRPVYRDRRFITLQRTLFTYLINKYISLSDICSTVHH